MNDLDEEEISVDSSAQQSTWRTGQWTVEEEIYASKIIELYMSGKLVVNPDDGRTLRTYLAKKLHCNPMRISKKFADLDCLRARYQLTDHSWQDIQNEQMILEKFEKEYREKDITVQSRRLLRRKYVYKNRKIDMDHGLPLDSSVNENSFENIEKFKNSRKRSASNSSEISSDKSLSLLSYVDITHSHTEHLSTAPTPSGRGSHVLESDSTSTLASDNCPINLSSDTALLDAANILAFGFDRETI
mmetsp:Transcript_26227/g.26468  ORF Transcript_26227/g.26468 Transcript_26227/m.26468 type:complete len:245 (-) Transcript_26227:280-1014(-)